MAIQIIYNEYPLNYDSQTGSFTVGNTVYGATSGAYATIRRIDRSGTTGTLYLESITGTFQDNEVIYETAVGSELLTGGDCSSDSFNDDDAGVAYDGVGEEYDWDGTEADAIIYQNPSLTLNYFYKLQFTVKNYASGRVKIYAGSSSWGSERTSDGTYTEYLQCAGDTVVYIQGGVYSASNFEGSVDDISCKQITNAALANGTVQSPITIDLALDRQGVIKNLKHERNIDHSYSGKVQIINQYGIQEMSITAMFSMATYYSLLAWWSWARQGKLWAFTMDSTKTGNTTLDGGAASGQTTIPLTATTGFSEDDICLLKREDLDDCWEIVTIASVSSGVSVTASANLKFNYTAGDSLRHLDYWPEVVSLDKSFKPTWTGAISSSDRYWRHTFKFTEAL